MNPEERGEATRPGTQGVIARGVVARGVVAKILTSSAVDGPGNRAVFFLQGCDFNCRYCHNPETRALCSGCGACVASCPTGALSLGSGGVSWDGGRCVGCDACLAACPEGSSPKTRLMSASEALAVIEPYRAFLSGITVSGGECGLQEDFLAELLEAAKARGLSGLVDTNGSTDYERLPRLVDVASGFMLDVKAWDEAEHRALTGSGNAAVKANLRFLSRAGKLHEARTVVVPGLFDADETVRETARALRAGADASGRAARYRLIRYRPQGARPALVAGLETPGDALMARLAELARAEGLPDVVVT